MTRPLVFLDTETTGLDPFTHHAYEVAWAGNDDRDPLVLRLPHTLEGADPNALDVGRYFERRFEPWHPHGRSSPGAGLRMDLRGAILVGANPGFDSVFLRKALGVQTWHYRLIDVEQMAQWICGFAEPRGLYAIREWLVALGHEEIPESDHTAAGDVLTTRAIYRILHRMRPSA